MQIFTSGREMYANLFASWLHVNFVVRTIVLILLAWLVIFLAAKLFQYVIGPMSFMLITLVGKPGRKEHRPMYSTHTAKLRRISLIAMLTSGIIVALWLGVFGIYQEYATQAITLVESNEGVNHEINLDILIPLPQEPQDLELPYNVILALSPQGMGGTMVHSGPGVEEYTVLEILWDYDQILFLNRIVSDTNGQHWVYVQTPSSITGFVNSYFVNMDID